MHRQRVSGKQHATTQVEKLTALFSNYLGRGSHQDARIAALTSLGLGVTVGTVTATGMAVNARTWAQFYTEGESFRFNANV